MWGVRWGGEGGVRVAKLPALSSSPSSPEFCSVQRHFYWHDSPKLTIQPEGRRHNLSLFSSLTSLLKISSASPPPPPPIMSSLLCALLFFLPSRSSSLTSCRLRHQPSHSILRSTPTQVAQAALGPVGGGVGWSERRRRSCCCCLSTPLCRALHAWKRVALGILPLAATLGKRASLVEEAAPRRSVHSKWSRRAALRRPQC